MSGEWTFRLPILWLAISVCLPSTAPATPPWSKLLSAGRVEADANKTYAIKEENGPYMIMACSFSGDNAEKQAKELVLELRKKYKVESYLHKVHFKLEDPNGPGAETVNSRLRWQYKRFHDRPNQYRDGTLKEFAVLVGNFRAVEDPDTQKTLKKIKLAEPDCLKIEPGRPTSRTFAGLRLLQQVALVESDKSQNYHVQRAPGGPMGRAFVTTNPLLPAEYYAPKGVVDDLVLKMNKNVKHSLLDCPGKYTVQVKRFTGEVTINQREIADIQSGLARKKEQAGLVAAAEQAHILTEALRLKGYEAYEFHDRYASIVTVGSFDSVGTPRADGKIEINPKVLAIIERFKAKQPTLVGQPEGSMHLEKLADIYFDIQPVPVEVPKRSISRELARRVDDE